MPRSHNAGDRKYDGKKPLILYTPRFLHDMTDVHVSAMDSHLLKGTDVTKVVRLVKSWGYCTEVRDDTVYKAVARYKKENILVKHLAAANNALGEDRDKTLEEKLDTLRARVEPLRELERLAQIQKSRVEKMILIEAKAPALMDSQSKNIALYSGILSDLVKIHMQTGVIKKVPLAAPTTETEGERALQDSLDLGAVPVSAAHEVLKELQASGILTDLLLPAPTDEEEDA